VSQQSAVGARAPGGMVSPVIGGSFFHLEAVAITDQACQGTACFVARHRDPERWAQAEGESPRVHCLGRCYAAPATASETARPPVEIDAPHAVVLGRVAAGGAPTLAAYRAAEGYRALERALGRSPAEIVDEIDASGLRVVLGGHRRDRAGRHLHVGPLHVGTRGSPLRIRALPPRATTTSITAPPVAGWAVAPVWTLRRCWPRSCA
jgi:hypothetical protein